jgi:general secretion pathway protein D
LTIRPDESAVQAGKEVRLSIVDGRLRASDQNLFRVEFDPKILRLKHVGEAEIVNASDPSSENNDLSGSITFRLTQASQRAPRSVNVTFIAMAPGVSPVRVELARPDGQEGATEVGTGIVRVR